MPSTYQDDRINEMSTLLEMSAEEQDNSPNNQTKTLLIKMPSSEEVNGDVETIGQSQHTFKEEVNYGFGEMSPVPKQAKDFYQGKRI